MSQARDIFEDDERGTGFLLEATASAQLGCPESSRPWTLKPPSWWTDRGVRPTWAQTGIPRGLKRADIILAPSSLTIWRRPSGGGRRWRRFPAG